MPQATRARLQLALGGRATLAGEWPSREGTRIFTAAEPSGRLVRIYLHPPANGGPDAWRDRVRRLVELGHPAMIAPEEVGTTDDGTWVLEPLPDELVVFDRLDEHGAFAVPEGIQHLREVARVLVGLHRRGLSHGALDLGAVHVADGTTVVAAFGARLTADPEQDLRDFGALAWLMLTGSVPPAAPRPIHQVRAGIPAEVAQALDRLLAPDAPPRALRAEAVLEAFDAYPTPHASPLDGLLDRAGQGARGRRNRAVMLAVGLAGLALLIAWLLSTRA
jgi:hypothetical protein